MSYDSYNPYDVDILREKVSELVNVNGHITDVERYEQLMDMIKDIKYSKEKYYYDKYNTYNYNYKMNDYNDYYYKKDMYWDEKHTNCYTEKQSNVDILIEAIKDGDLDTVLGIYRYVDPGCKSNGQYAMRLALEYRKMDIVKGLIGDGVKIDSDCVYTAISCNDCDLVMFCLEHQGNGYRIATSELFRMILRIKGYEDIVHYCLKRGFLSEQNILIWSMHDLDIFKKFIKKYSVLDSRRLMIEAIRYPGVFSFLMDRVQIDLEIFRKILESRDVNLADLIIRRRLVTKEMVMHFADSIFTLNYMAGVVRVIFEVFGFADSDLDLMMECACRHGAGDIIPIIIENGSSRINDFLLIACRLGTIDAVRYIVRNGADARFNDDVCITRAMQDGNTRVVEYLISLGCRFVSPLEKEYLNRVSEDDPYDPRIDEILFPKPKKKKVSNNSRKMKKLSSLLRTY